MKPIGMIVAVLLAAPASAQTTNPFAEPIRATDGTIRVDYREFATLPDIDGTPARMMMLLAEPGGQRLFVNDMRGPLYTLSADGRTVTEYLDTDASSWRMDVQSSGRERGFQSFALHPQFNERGTPGFGRLYTWSDVTDTVPAPDFAPGGGGDSHDTVLLEWIARTPGAATYDGGPPRELIRVQQPFGNHNGGQIGFNPTAAPGGDDYGLLYIGNADGGSGGDPLDLAENHASAFGKILRIDPFGRNSANGEYGIPADNPFVDRGAGALGEVYALGVRNPQRFGWDAATGTMYVADIGQNVVEELSPVPRGGNLGWNTWEGSFRYGGRTGIDTAGARSDRAMTYPIAEYDHTDPVLVGRAAVTGVVVYRGTAIPQLTGRILFGDNPSGEVFHVSADDPPDGGQASIGRVLLNDNGTATTLLQLIRAKNTQQGREPAGRADLRFGTDADGQVFLLNKQDGIVRLLVQDRE
ncbi:MAG: PQQ-dependent sugar dehydrogenase [Gemmatimonadota bacterium]